MPHTGNDVVDLLDPANAGKSGDSRYLAKILTNAECEFVGKSVKPDVALWSLWVGKETAYKVVRKIRQNIRFLPLRYEVQFSGGNLLKESTDGKVIIMGKETVFIRLFSCFAYVHCIGSDSVAALDKIHWRVDALPLTTNSPDTDISLAVRQQLAAALAAYHNVNLADLAIKRLKKNGILQPPVVYLAGKKTNIDISLSHDGRFTAFAFL